MKTLSLLTRLFLLLVLFAASLPGLPARAADESESLLRLEATSTESFDALVESGVALYGPIDLPDGRVIVYLPTADIPSSLLSSAISDGIKRSTLAAPAGDELFFAAHALDTTWSNLPDGVTLIDSFDLQAVLAVAPGAEESLAQAGFNLRLLTPHTLRLPEAVAAPAYTVPLPHPLVAGLVGQLNRDNLIDTVRELSGEDLADLGNGETARLTSRYTYNAAAMRDITRYAYHRLASYGLNVAYDEYNFLGYSRRNVVAEQPGVVEPDKIVIVCAHIDSRSETYDSSYYDSPGADDNASGSAAVLRIAEILSKHRFAYTIRYILFTGEEQGHNGSQAYAREAAARDDNILAVLNLDMIGFDSGSTREFRLHTRPGSNSDYQIANLFVSAVSGYGINLNPRIIADGKSFSDHNSFWQQGYPAVLGIDRWDDYPDYHETSDTVDKLNQSYYERTARAGLATLAHLALPYSPNLTGWVTHSGGAGVVSGVLVIADGTGGPAFTTTTGLDGSYEMMLDQGVYDLTFQAEGYATGAMQDVSVTANNLALNADLCQFVGGVWVSSSILFPNPGDPVTFTAAALAGSPPLTFTWNFNDGAPPTNGLSAVFNFPAPGMYRVTLSAQNACTAPLNTTYYVFPGGDGLYLPLIR